ncbi:MAG: hypothetical protein WAV27_20305 [Xanthobacteraceae bacterium]
MSTTTILPRTLALTLAFGFTSAAMLAPAHATDGRTAAQMCINRDDCTITPGPNGSFVLTLDGGGVIWCPDVNGECVVVSPDTRKVGQAPVAAPIGKSPVAAAPPNPTTGSPVPTGTHPAPTGNHPTSPKPVSGSPIVFHPFPINHKPIVKSPAPVILVRSAHSSGHRR